MIRATSAALLTLAVVSTSAFAQDGPLNRVGRALDRTGKNIRSTVETEVARGQISAEERDVLNKVGKRIDWDKQMAGSTLRLEVQPGGVVVLQGSVLSEAAKLRAVDLVENTTGVTSVVDQLAVVKGTKVTEAPRETRVIETRKAAPIVKGTSPVIVVPSESKVIVKP
ncbi:BON domain-containing protein [Tundrisphaera lichenicola]|uniref:BON domain-containing protein n=1 Tax=Tundrisphaera lichenicola TaxID=2029860 RepID=UPI003EB80371